MHMFTEPFCSTVCAFVEFCRWCGVCHIIIMFDWFIILYLYFLCTFKYVPFRKSYTWYEKIRTFIYIRDTYRKTCMSNVRDTYIINVQDTRLAHSDTSLIWACNACDTEHSRISYIVEVELQRIIILSTDIFTSFLLYFVIHHIVKCFVKMQ